MSEVNVVKEMKTIMEGPSPALRAAEAIPALVGILIEVEPQQVQNVFEAVQKILKTAANGKNHLDEIIETGKALDAVARRRWFSGK